MDKLVDFFSKKPKTKKGTLPSVEQVLETKKEVRDALRKLNQQNRKVAQMIKEKTQPEEISKMDLDDDCTTCKKFSSILNNKDKLNKLTEVQKQGAKKALNKCNRCKETYCDTNLFETIEDIELCNLITQIIENEEIMAIIGAEEMLKLLQ
jgi:hypothetical protein